MHTVTLTEEEHAEAVAFGNYLCDASIAAGRDPCTGASREVQRRNTIDGSLSEMAFSKWSGHPWHKQKDRFGKPDVGLYQVRCVRGSWKGLKVRASDTLSHVFVLMAMLDEEGYEWEVVGWHIGSYVVDNHDHYLPAENDYPECWILDRDKLNPIETLPEVVEV
jgi:hypothetical protein